jgi:long-chain fatty acid transport protein
MKPRILFVAAIMIVLAVGLSSNAWAQTDEEHWLTLNFNIASPGARPMAMGGAFIGLADDASAAITNPAGLTWLTKRQFYIEYKNMYAPVARLDRADSFLTGVGHFSPGRENVPGFLNISIPLPRRMTFAFGFRQFLKYADNYQLPARRVPSVFEAVFPAVSTDLNFSGIGFNASLAVPLTDKFKFGITGGYSRLSGRQTSVRTPLPTASGQTVAFPNTDINGSSWAPDVTVGLLYNPVQSIGIGFMYSRQPKFKLPETIITSGQPTTTANVAFSVPDRVGIGMSWRPHPRYLFLVDAVRISYSQVADNMQLVMYQNFTARYVTPHFPAGTPQSVIAAAVAAQPQPVASDFSIKNTFDIHMGGEVNVLSGKNPVFVRYGFFTTQAHPLQYAKGACFATLQTQASGGNPPIWTGSGDCAGQKNTAGQFIEKPYPAQIPAEYVNLPASASIGNIQGPNANGQYTCSDCIMLGARDYGFSLGGGVVLGRGFQLDLAYSRTWTRRQEFVISSAIRF